MIAGDVTDSIAQVTNPQMSVMTLVANVRQFT